MLARWLARLAVQGAVDLCASQLGQGPLAAPEHAACLALSPSVAAPGLPTHNGPCNPALAASSGAQQADPSVDQETLSAPRPDEPLPEAKN